MPFQGNGQARRSARVPVPRVPYSPTPWNRAASYTESDTRSPVAKPTPKATLAQVSLSARPEQSQGGSSLFTTPARAEGLGLFSKPVDKEQPRVQFDDERPVTTEEIFNMWHGAEPEVQSEVFMAIGNMVFANESNDRAADRILSFLIASSETTRYSILSCLVDEAKRVGALPESLMQKVDQQVPQEKQVHRTTPTSDKKTPSGGEGESTHAWCH